MAGMDEWGEIEFRLFDDIAGHNDAMYSDWRVQNLYDAALFDHDVSTSDRTAILNTLRDFLWDEYGIDFDDVFDWEGFREAYDNAQV